MMRGEVVFRNRSFVWRALGVGFRTDAGIPFDLPHPFYPENFHGRTHLARRAKGDEPKEGVENNTRSFSKGDAIEIRTVLKEC